MDARDAQDLHNHPRPLQHMPVPARTLRTLHSRPPRPNPTTADEDEPDQHRERHANHDLRLPVNPRPDNPKVSRHHRSDDAMNTRINDRHRATGTGRSPASRSVSPNAPTPPWTPTPGPTTPHPAQAPLYQATPPRPAQPPPRAAGGHLRR